MKWDYIIVITVVILCVVAVCIVLIQAYNGALQCNDHCKKIGWEGHSIVGGGSCYKKEPHESGVGTVMVYSGKIECGFSE